MPFCHSSGVNKQSELLSVMFMIHQHLFNSFKLLASAVRLSAAPLPELLLKLTAHSLFLAPKGQAAFSAHALFLDWLSLCLRNIH